MKPRTFLFQLLSIAMTAAGSMLPVADGRAEPPGGQVWTPHASIEHADHIGRFAHTNTKIFVPTGGIDNVHPPSGGEGPQIAPCDPSLYYETPASLGCIYGLTSVSSTGCNPTKDLPPPAGGAKAIAIVDAFDYPTAF